MVAAPTVEAVVAGDGCAATVTVDKCAPSVSDENFLNAAMPIGNAVTSIANSAKE